MTPEEVRQIVRDELPGCCDGRYLCRPCYRMLCGAHFSNHWCNGKLKTPHTCEWKDGCTTPTEVRIAGEETIGTMYCDRHWGMARQRSAS